MKRAILTIGAALAVIALLIVRLPFLFNANQFRPRIEADLTAALGRKVTFGNLSLSLFSGSLTASNLSIAEDRHFGTSPFLRAKALELGVDLWPLITAHELNIRNLTLTEPEIALRQNSGGDWNFSSRPGESEAPLDLSVKLVRLTNGRLSIRRLASRQKPIVLDNVNLELKDFAPHAQFPFSLTGKLAPAGDVSIGGTAGPIDLADPSLTPVQFSLKVFGADIAGPEIAADPGLAGLLSFDGAGAIQASDDDTTVNLKGRVHLDHPKFVPQGTPAKDPIDIDISLAHNLDTHAGVLTQGDIHFGNTSASLTGSYEESEESGEATSVKLHLAGSAIPIAALTGMLAPFDIQLPAGSSLEGGVASVNLVITGLADAPAIAGTASLSNTKLKGFDLASKVGTLERLAGLHPAPDTVIQTLSANLRSDARGTAIQNLKFIAPAIGEVEGAGTIGVKHDLDFKMRVKLQREDAARIALGSSVPFFLQGTSTNPEVKPDVAGIASSEARRLAPGRVLNGLFGDHTPRK